MPLYDETTNLQSQGRFAPGVSYRASIKAPVQSSPSLEKAREVFNIDLSRIGDAMINAQDNEYKLQASIVNMEQDMREAEAKRQLALDLAEKEDKRLREFKQADLEVEWYKAQTERAKKNEEDFTAAAQRSFLEDPEINQAFIDYNNGNITNVEMSRKVQAAALRTSRQYPGVPMGKLLSVASSLGWTTGLGGQIETNDEIRDQQQKAQIAADTAIGKTLDPSATEADAAVYGANFRSEMQRVRQLNEIISNPNSGQLSKDMAKRQLQNDLDSIISSSMHSNMVTTGENLRKVNNPFEYVESMKQMITIDIAARTGSKEDDVRRRVDAAFKMHGIDSTLQGILGDAKTDAEYKKNALDAYYNNYKLGMYTTYPMVMAYVAFGDLMQHLEGDEKKAAASILAKTIWGGYAPSEDKKYWTIQHGYPYNQTTQYSEQELGIIRDKLGLKNTEQAAMYLAMMGTKELSQSLGSGRISDENAANFTENAAKIFTGNPNPDGTLYGLPVEDQKQVMENIQKCVDSGYCTKEDYENIASNMQDERKKSIALKYANIWGGQYKLSKSFRNENESKNFWQDVNYLIPDNFEFLNLKNSVMWYAYGEDGDIYIDYTEDGWIKTGYVERGRRSDRVRDRLNRAGLTIPEKLEFYNLVYPNLTENTDPNKDKQWMRRVPVMAQEATLSAGAQFDTWLASQAANLSKGRENAVEMARHTKADTSEQTESSVTTTQTLDTDTIVSAPEQTSEADAAFDRLVAHRKTEQTESSETELSPEAEEAFNKLVSDESNDTPEQTESSENTDDIYINTSTGEAIIPNERSEGWNDFEYKGKVVSWYRDGEYVTIQDSNGDLITGKTDKSGEELYYDIQNNGFEEVNKYIPLTIYKKKGSD